MMKFLLSLLLIVVSSALFPQCEVVINPIASNSGCFIASSDVVWKDLVNVNVSGNDISRTSGNGWGTSGAASLNEVSNNMFMKTVANGTNKYRMIGLSNNNLNANYTSIEYALYLVQGGSLQIYESGSYKGSFGTYATGDTLMIYINNNVVEYYKNDNLIFTSLVIPTLPLVVDASIYSNNGILEQVTVGGTLIDSFTCSAFNMGLSPSYQWILNGLNVGLNSDSYVNSSLNDNDVLTCEVTPSIGFCSGVVQSSNTLILNETSHVGMTASISITPSLTGCFVAEMLVDWTDLELITINGNDISRTSGNGWGTCGAASINSLSNNMYFYSIVNEVDKRRMIGLSNINANSNYSTIDFAFYMVANGTLRIYESGANRGNFGTYSTNDTLMIKIESGIVNYYKNNNLLYTSLVSPVLPLIIDVSINQNDGTIGETYVGSIIENLFTCNANNFGTNPIYDWFLNGSSTGINTLSYINNSLVDGDEIYCAITPDFINCSGLVVQTNKVKIKAQLSSSFFADIQPIYNNTGCKTATTNVTWIDKQNVTESGFTLTKNSANSWDGGAASVNELTNNMFMYTIAQETNKYRMVGLSNLNSNAHYNTIEYAIYMAVNGVLQIYESGTSKGSFGTYATGDTLEIKIENSIINYYKNGDIFYTSLIAPTFPLIVDVSFYSNNGTLKDVTIGGYIQDQFLCVANGFGASPSYQWKLNGNNVGSNLSSYTNNNLADLDELYCEVTPDISNCSSSSVSTGMLKINAQIATNLVAEIKPVYYNTGCKTAVTDVIWVNKENVTESGNTLTKNTANGWNGGAASVNELTNEMFMYTIAQETNKYRMIGLSSVNSSIHYNTINYAIYMANGGVLQVYENGSNKGSFGNYSTGDSLEIRIENNIINYYKNGVSFYTSLVAPILPLIVDVSIYSNNGTIKDVTIGGYVQDQFLCAASGVGVSPVYQWKLNGNNVGTNQSTYTNNNLADTDILQCDIVPDLSNCALVQILTNTIVIKEEQAPSIDFSVSPTLSSTGCLFGLSEIVWVDIVNGNVSQNDFQRVSGSGWGSSGAASINELNDNMFLYTVVDEVNTHRMFGLSNVNTNANYNTIDFALYLRNNGQIRIYEAGVNKGAFGNYATGDTLKIEAISGVIKYFNNSTLLYTSTVTPTFPLLADLSINTNGGTIKDATFGSIISNTFNCNVLNAGASPSYQWFLNGNPVGTNMSTYVNNSLVSNDLVSCQLFPDISNCANTNFISNSIKILGTNYSYTEWLGTNSTDWFNALNWSNGIPLLNSTILIPSSASQFPVINGMNAECQQITIENGAELYMIGTDTLTVNGFWGNEGNFISSSGTISLKPSCQTGMDFYNLNEQSIYNLIVDGGLSINILGDTLSIHGVLSLEDGNLETNGKLKMISDGNETARITEIKNGTLTGDVLVERYIDAGATQWRFLSFSVSGQTLESFDDDFVTTGFPGTDYPNFPSSSNPWSSFYFYDEVLGTTFNDGYYVPSSTADVLGVGQGVWIWCGDTITGTQPFVIDAYGPINQGDINLPVSYTPSSGIVNEDGWNMVANPYPCTIDWDAADWTKTNIGGAIFIWDPDNLQYTSYVGGVGTNLGSNKIASSQAFWVHSTGASPVLQIKESCKINEDHGFIKKAGYQPELLRLELNSNSSDVTDETVVRFEINATDNFDEDFDALKFYSGDVNSIQIASVLNQKEYTINTIEKQNSLPVIDFRIISSNSDSCTLKTTDISGIQNMNCVILEDLITGDKTNLLIDSIYSFYHVAGDTNVRFSIQFSEVSTFNIVDVSCFGEVDGEIEVILNSNISSNIEWFNNAGVSVKNSTSLFSDSLQGLKPGVYAVHQSLNSSVCPIQIDSIEVSQPNKLEIIEVITYPSCETCCDGEITTVINGGTEPYQTIWSNNIIDNNINDLCPAIFSIEIEDENGCLYSETYDLLNPLTDNTIEKDQILIYPNPTSDYLYIKSENIDINSIDVYNIAGQSVSSKILVIDESNQIKLDIHELSIGTYLLQVGNFKISFIVE